MTTTPQCINVDCPKTVPMMKLALESNIAREMFFCPCCGEKRERKPLEGTVQVLQAGAALGMMAIAAVTIISTGEPSIDVI